MQISLYRAPLKPKSPMGMIRQNYRLPIQIRNRNSRTDTRSSWKRGDPIKTRWHVRTLSKMVRHPSDLQPTFREVVDSTIVVALAVEPGDSSWREVAEGLIQPGIRKRPYCLHYLRIPTVKRLDERGFWLSSYGLLKAETFCRYLGRNNYFFGKPSIKHPPIDEGDFLRELRSANSFLRRRRNPRKKPSTKRDLIWILSNGLGYSSMISAANLKGVQSRLSRPETREVEQIFNRHQG